MRDILNDTKKRFTNFNNTDFNDRHRKYGKALHSMDIDLIHFDNNYNPVILIESKHGCTQLIDMQSYQIKCQEKLANKYNIPYFIALYYFPGENYYNGKVNEFGLNHKYYIIPVNNIARSWMEFGDPAFMSELSFVTLLYKIRNQQMPENLELDNYWDCKINPPLIKNSIFVKFHGDLHA